tara:strand:- start:59 stop:235 length:177 start_codon:yes stop_codon:yes gene_type:complete
MFITTTKKIKKTAEEKYKHLTHRLKQKKNKKNNRKTNNNRNYSENNKYFEDRNLSFYI